MSQETIKMFIAKVAARAIKVEGAEVDNAGLYGNMNKHGFKRLLTGSTKKNIKSPGKICLVVKLLYVTRQAGITKGSYLHKKLINWNFVKSSQGQRLYHLVWNNRVLVLINVVNDMTPSSNEQQLIDNF